MLRVNPEVAKVLKSNHNSYLQEIEEILGKSVLVKSDPLLHQTNSTWGKAAVTGRLCRQLSRTRGALPAIVQMRASRDREPLLKIRARRGDPLCHDAAVRNLIGHGPPVAISAAIGVCPLAFSFPLLYSTPAYITTCGSGYNHQTGQRRPHNMANSRITRTTTYAPPVHFVLFALIVIAFIGLVVDLIRHFGSRHGRTHAGTMVIITFAIYWSSFSAAPSRQGAGSGHWAEENLRHFALTGKLLDHLTIKQVIALRFASDGEFVDLARKAADAMVFDQTSIKKSIKNWRVDNYRSLTFEGWWAVRDSNPRPPRCKRGALTS